jgi:bisphosphoglycerate-independent phosphoglycerate mutase (AlkP superfamily)
LRNGLSVYHDITNEKLRYRGFDVPMFSIEQAGEIVARQIQQYNFLIYEFFQTDQIGHAQNLEHANNILKKLDTFLNVILKYSNMENTLIIITSDHGNIEDLSVKTHTLSPAMTILFGDHRFAAQDHLFSIQDITPWILSFAK